MRTEIRDRVRVLSVNRVIPAAHALLALCAAVFLATSALAEVLPKFEELDENDDGKLSLEEAKEDPDIAARFALADLDRDGYLSRYEFDNRAQP